MQGALIQKDNVPYEFTSSDGKVIVSPPCPVMGWHPGLFTPDELTSPGSSATSCSCCPMSTSQTLAHTLCPRADQTFFILLDGFCMFRKVQFHYFSGNHLRFFPCTLRTRRFLHPLNSSDIHLSTTLLRYYLYTSSSYK